MRELSFLKPGEGIKLLEKHVASGAFHNSAERYDPPKCHPGTREAIINEIMDWIQTTDKEEFILWLYGPAGAGKSAIAQTIAELCSRMELLAASFFFSRTAASRNGTTRLIPTIAYQLAISIPEILKHICFAIEKDPLIFTRSLEAQLETLILQPLAVLPLHQNLPGEIAKSRPRLIIIDGLDECREVRSQRYILTTLSSCLRRYSTSLIFLIASRPEQEIRDAFNKGKMSLMTRRLVLDDTYEPDADIKIFLASEFRKIKKHHPLASYLLPTWPSESDIDHLIRKASGQFIYASIVMKFIESSRHRPTERLDIVLGLKAPGKQTPFAELDSLYTWIFASVDDIESVLDIFMFLLLFNDEDPQKNMPSTVERFWGYQPGHLQIILLDLHSVILVPSPHAKEDKLRIFHASLVDFLTDKSRSGTFFIDPPKAHARIAEYCIRNTSSLLKRKPSSDNDESLDKHLEISCRNFMGECSKAYPTKELLQELRSFRLDEFFALSTVFPRLTWVARELLAVDLPDFFNWLQYESSPTHTQACLYQPYIAQLDSFLHSQLSNYPSSDLSFQHLLTALTLDSCEFNVDAFSSIIDTTTGWSDNLRLQGMESNDNSLLRLIASVHRCPKYRSMLIAFFTDRIRSGSYYRDKAKYLTLAMKCWEHLRLTASVSYPIECSSTYECASIITLEVLSRFPRDHQLVEFLQANPIRKNVYQKEKTVLTINEYIKDYNLSKTGPYSSRLDLSEIPSSTATTSSRQKRKRPQVPLLPVGNRKYFKHLSASDIAGFRTNNDAE